MNMKYLFVGIVATVIGFLAADYPRKSNSQLITQWNYYPVTCNDLKAKNGFSITGVQIGFREDGMVVWREPKQSPERK